MKPIRTFLLVALAVITSSLQALENEAARREHLERLRGAMRVSTRLNQGKAPARLIQLVDEGLIAGTGALMRPGSRVIPTRGELEAHGSYTLEALPGVTDMMIRERAPMPGETEVLAIFKDGTIQALPFGPAVASAAPAPIARPPDPSVTAPLPAPKPVAPVNVATATTPADGGASRRIGDWLAGRPVTLPGKSKPIAPIFGGSAAAPEVTTNNSTAGAPANAPVDPNVALGLLQKLLGDRPGGAEALANATQSSERMRELQQRFDSELNRVQQSSGASGLSPQLIEILLEMEKLTRPRTPPPVAVTTSPNFVPPPPANPNAGDVLDQINRAARGEPMVTAQSPANAPAPTARGAASATSSGAPPTAPAVDLSGDAKWKVTRQFVQGLPWRSASWSEAQVRAASEVGHQAERAKDYAKMVGPFTDMAGYGLAKKPRDNNSDQLLESIAWYQERQLGLGNSPELAYTRNNLGVIYTASGTFGAAEGEFEKARRIWEAQTPSGGVPSGDYAVMLHNFAVLREQQGKSAEATQLAAQASEIMARRRAAGLP